MFPLHPWSVKVDGEEEDPIFRVHVKMHNSDGAENSKEYFVQAECENTAVVKVLEYADAPVSFGAINVHMLKNAVIIG